MIFAGKGRWTLIAMLLCLSAGLQAATLKIATLSPPGSAWMQAMEAAGVRIAAETEGRVTLRFYPGGVMGDDTAVLRKIRFGQLQGAALTTGALQNDFTDVQLYNLPMLFNDFDEVDALRAQFDPALLAGLEEAGWVAFGFAEAGFAYAMSKAEVTTLPEARALKVWVPSDDKGSEASLRGFGLSAVPLSIADVLPGLQTQLIDAIAAPPVAAVALQWFTQLQAVLDLPFMYVYGTLALQRKAFERLSAEDQAVLRTVLSETFAAIGARNRADHEQAMAALKAQGLRFLAPSPEARAEWVAAAATARQEMIDSGAVSAERYAALQAALRAYRTP
jgi:TRAP-type C4-dicarboxylate transport system substrate-binding protein